jgi:AraC family transcriptional regulator of adaptative response/methylated-DNA-[protein]-cysteine methyltransferase
MTEQIRFSINESSIGLSLVAFSEKGMCAILLGDNRNTLVKELKKRFKNAECLEEVRETNAILESGETSEPLDLRGTVFQKKVWNALRKIPSGKTATYAEIAKKIGAPTSMRAVAQACGANNIAVVIPCHRVIRTDGSLSGYRWGVERKKELLRREGSSH